MRPARPHSHACAGGHVDVVEWLVGRGADITVAWTATMLNDKVDCDFGLTPIQIASRLNRLNVVEWVSHQSCTPNAATGVAGLKVFAMPRAYTACAMRSWLTRVPTLMKASPMHRSPRRLHSGSPQVRSNAGAGAVFREANTALHTEKALT